MRTSLDDIARDVNNGTLKVCDECDRMFDLMDEDDAAEFFYGHDCE